MTAQHDAGTSARNQNADLPQSRFPRLAWAWGEFRRWPVIPAFILTALILLAALAPVIAPYHPIRGDLAIRSRPPLFSEPGRPIHLLGTDQQGRDMFTRLLYGSRVSLVFAAATIGLGLAVGTLLGAMAGYFGGHVDEAIMRVVDLSNALPFILIALVAVSIFGSSFMTLMVMLAFFTWGRFARQVRGEVLHLRQVDYVLIAQIAGASFPRIAFKHLLPGVMNVLIVIATLRAGQIILAEAVLSFLGVGVPPPNPAWGSMVADGRNYLEAAPWISAVPGIAIGLTVLSLNFLGDWMRDFFDPTLRQAERR